MVHQAGTFSLPLDGTLVHCRVTSSTAFPDAHTFLYSLVERGHSERKVSCTRAKHNVPGQGPDCSTRTLTTFRLPQFWSIPVLAPPPWTFPVTLLRICVDIFCNNMLSLLLSHLEITLIDKMPSKAMF